MISQAFPGFKSDLVEEFSGAHVGQPQYRKVRKDVPYEGMTLRQYYAGQVLPEIIHVFALTAMKTGHHFGRTEEVLAALAYADELIKQEAASA